MLGKTRCMPHSSHAIKTSYYRLMPVQCAENGIITRTTEFREFDSVAELSKFGATDFSLANLIAIGATGNLSPIVMSRSSDITYVDEFTRSITSVPVEPANPSQS